MMANGSKWKMADLNLVRGSVKQRQSEDRLRADAWRKKREAELEAVVNRDYDPREIPEIAEAIDALYALAAPPLDKIKRLIEKHYPAEFSRPSVYIGVSPGGIFDQKMRDRIRRDATKHLADRHAYMLANSATYTTEKLHKATTRATNNPEVIEMLDELRAPNEATPTLEPPGPAIGVLAKLLPHPEEWGFDGYGDSSPLLPRPTAQEALPAPDKDDGEDRE
jgi:hypothetical protein